MIIIFLKTIKDMVQHKNNKAKIKNKKILRDQVLYMILKNKIF